MEDIEYDLNRIEKELKHLAQFRQYRTEIKCPVCGGTHIFKFKHDGDWSGGDYYPVNDRNTYPADAYEYGYMDSTNRPDIELYHCFDCDTLFE